MQDEYWVQIAGYEGLYEVSNCGRVKSLDRVIFNSGTPNGLYTVKGRILTQRINNKRNGYCELSLHKDGKEKRYKVHRLVAEAFLPNPDNLPEVNHIDGNKENNNVKNLEWCTSKQNKEHGWNTGLYTGEHRKSPIKCNETGICYESVVQASELIPCDRSAIFRVLSGKKDRVKGLTFSYITQKELREYRGENT